MFALASGGLAIGKEGPFVHMTCIIVLMLLTHVPAFRIVKITKPCGSKHLPLQLL